MVVNGKLISQRGLRRLSSLSKSTCLYACMHVLPNADDHDDHDARPSGPLLYDGLIDFIN